MNTNKFKLTPLAIAIGMIAGAPVHADVERRQINQDNLIVEVTDDRWQPEEFVNGMPVPAVYHRWADHIEVDGIADEEAWKRAIDTQIPLTYGNTDSASVKVLYTDEEIYFRVRWADDDENREHHPWVWSEQLGKYVERPEAEDYVLLSFEAGCEWNPSL
ncbi:MAG: hypothetical protein HUJ31_09320, partial [Pseudomonadales bacterium]|nr:hypothetical protein [Pseudomonadales bacterium]